MMVTKRGQGKRILLALLTAVLLCGTALAFAGCKKEEGVKITEIVVINPQTGEVIPSNQYGVQLNYTGQEIAFECHVRVKGETRYLENVKIDVVVYMPDTDKYIKGNPVEKGKYVVTFDFEGISEKYRLCNQVLVLTIE